VNRVAEDITKYNRRELTRMNIADLVPAPVKEIAASEFQKLSEFDGYYLKNCFLRADGTHGIWSAGSVRLPEDRRLTIARMVL
jgi:PAS domain-containing protein